MLLLFLLLLYFVSNLCLLGYSAVCTVFFFVAMWHDAEMKLLLWGLLNSVFFLVEVNYSLVVSLFFIID